MAGQSMRQPEEVLRDLVRRWIAKADGDYAAAGQLLKSPGQVREIIAFHCQQASEKYLKALMVRLAVEFPKTHDIGLLLELLAAAMPDFASALSDVKALTPYGVEVRYPGDFPDVLPGQDAAAFDLATRVKASVMGLLESYLAEH